MIYNFIKQIKKCKPIAEGAGRRVYIIGDYVLKVAKNKRGITENQNEYYLYNNIDETIKTFLCPVIAINNKYLLMKKADLIDLETFDNRILPEVINIINLLYEKYNIDDFDLKYNFNWGMINNKPVIIDYGYNYFGECLEF